MPYCSTVLLIIYFSCRSIATELTIHVKSKSTTIDLGWRERWFGGTYLNWGTSTSMWARLNKCKGSVDVRAGYINCEEGWLKKIWSCGWQLVRIVGTHNQKGERRKDQMWVALFLLFFPSEIHQQRDAIFGSFVTAHVRLDFQTDP